LELKAELIGAISTVAFVLFYLWKFLNRSRKKKQVPKSLKSKSNKGLPTREDLKQPTSNDTFKPEREKENMNLVNEADSQIEYFFGTEQQLPVEAFLHIDYVGSEGKSTQRTIQVISFGILGPDTIIHARCQLRKARRTFRTSRIVSCISLPDGELITDVTAHLNKLHEKSIYPAEDRLLSEYYDLLQIFLYVGRADGQLRSAERDVIKRTCIGLTQEDRFDDKSIDSLLQYVQTPSLQSFRLAVGRIKALNNGELNQLLIETCKEMVATQKAVHANETEALSYLSKRLLT
jgi:hypothetical protein